MLALMLMTALGASWDAKPGRYVDWADYAYLECVTDVSQTCGNHGRPIYEIAIVEDAVTFSCESVYVPGVVARFPVEKHVKGQGLLLDVKLSEGNIGEGAKPEGGGQPVYSGNAFLKANERGLTWNGPDLCGPDTQVVEGKLKTQQVELQLVAQADAHAWRRLASHAVGECLGLMSAAPVESGQECLFSVSELERAP